MKTRILAMLLAVVMAVSLTACTSSDSRSSKTATCGACGRTYEAGDEWRKLHEHRADTYVQELRPKLQIHAGSFGKLRRVQQMKKYSYCLPV